jgi:cell shape-determining protein MreC
VEGTAEARCLLNYLPRQEDVRVGDIIMSSGFDGIFPKGLSIGYVSKIIRRNTGLFQEIEWIRLSILTESKKLWSSSTHKLPILKSNDADSDRFCWRELS